MTCAALRRPRNNELGRRSSLADAVTNRDLGDSLWLAYHSALPAHPLRLVVDDMPATDTEGAGLALLRPVDLILHGTSATPRPVRAEAVAMHGTSAEWCRRTHHVLSLPRTSGESARLGQFNITGCKLGRPRGGSERAQVHTRRVLSAPRWTLGGMRQRVVARESACANATACSTPSMPSAAMDTRTEKSSTVDDPVYP